MPAPETSIDGEYIANGLTYTYEGTWSVVKTEIWWRAQVKYGDMLIASPEGHFQWLATENIDPKAVAKNLIEGWLAHHLMGGLRIGATDKE